MIEKAAGAIFSLSEGMSGYAEPCIFGEEKGAYDETPMISFGHMYHGITYSDEAYSEETQGRMTLNFGIPK